MCQDFKIQDTEQTTEVKGTGQRHKSVTTTGKFSAIRHKRVINIKPE